MKNSARRISQIIFFLLFIILLIQTEYKGTDELGQPVRLFLGLDPLIAAAVVITVKGIFFYVLGIGAAIALSFLAKFLIGKFFKDAPWAENAQTVLGRLFPIALAVIFLAWAVFPFGLDRGWALAMALGSITVIVTLIFGRLFCGWFCPMGSVLQFVSWLKKDKRKNRIAKNRYNPHQNWKYYILIGLLLSAFIGFNVIGMFDPISMVIRSFSITVNPLVNQAANSVLDVAYETNNDTIIDATRWGYDLIAYPAVLSFDQPHFKGGLIVSAFFIFVLALCFVRPRFWCRVLCPLGAFLGTISRHTPYQLQMAVDKCSGCGKCSTNCQGACDPEFIDGWRPAECFVCYHCVDACPTEALKFSFTDIKDKNAEKQQIGLDLKKRRAFQAVGASLVAVPLIRATDQYKMNTGGAAGGRSLHNPALVRPPGAVPEEEFLQRCVRCGECMKVCPTNGLHPTTLEAGLEGMWTPILVPRLGYCEYYCTLCGQVCPTGAIQELDVDTKINTIIGTAFFDFNRCLPYAFGVDCIVCEEHCPTSPKAIWFEEVPRPVKAEEDPFASGFADPYGDSGGGQWASPTEMAEETPAEDTSDGPAFDDPYASDASSDPYGGDAYSDPYGGGSTNDSPFIKHPRIDLEKCIGCGICEKVCVVADKPAIRITSVGEDRSNENRIIFKGSYEEGY